MTTPVSVIVQLLQWQINTSFSLYKQYIECSLRWPLLEEAISQERLIVMKKLKVVLSLADLRLLFIFIKDHLFILTMFGRGRHGSEKG